ncbi:formyltetrahydrofolate synthetase [Methylophaga aminisulfidivorans MP]|uniref:Formate--tetrahydrofolate ligase n=1 Tax=Methylophaga aminisulfidivorans MP TaxID=1026882 RepID=F5SZY7_9GAMM|nr:formate--tetrahydrofolate ligase [Methylophaga aminisulfidivorans]EGL54765.1 formyltetrahydrofolate synthetase [Methylophaga aminisulfidivorans MP]
MSDIEIAQQASMQEVTSLAEEKLGLASHHIDPYGRFKAKVSLEVMDDMASKADGKLILVTAISPTPAGEGKTTTTIGLSDALNRIGKKSIVCVREPSMGPCFGMKGGAAGGGYAQVVPMEDINLHFTGDLHAIASAHNLLSAMIDNHIHHGNALQLDARRIVWQRVMDMNDRALRDIVVGMGGPANGYLREERFDIVVASEVMAIFCLSNSLQELKQRLGEILIAYSVDGTPRYARDIMAHGAMAALLKEAIKPNLVQTLENNPAFVHGGPFANIAHGCNSVISTKMALKLGDYVVTEAGFGADLGAEKFINIKCRKAGIKPDMAVVVATVKALKYHGGLELKELTAENLNALNTGLANLKRHLSNLQNEFGLRCVVAINHFVNDSDAEIELIKTAVKEMGAEAILARHWAEGGAGAETLAQRVVEMLDADAEPCQLLYPDSLPLWDKINEVAKRLYGTGQVVADKKVMDKIAMLNEQHGDIPVCMAKTPYSFSSDPSLRGTAENHTLTIRDVRLSNGAGFLVVLCGDVMTMPGLPKHPAAERIDIDENGSIVGLF